MKQHARRFAVLVLCSGGVPGVGTLAGRPLHRVRGQHCSATGSRRSGERGGGSFGLSTTCSPSALTKTPARPASLSLTQIRAIAFVWIAALQAGVAWLVLSSANEVAHRQQTKTESVSLKRYNDLLRTRDAVIFGLAKLAESRDPDTGNHLERIAIYSTRLASELRRNSRYRNQINSQFLQLIGISSSLHDIGKVGIADSILMKPGRFAEEERLVMQMHVAIGGKCVQDIETRLGQSNFLQMAREIALCHHERWDGSGLPGRSFGRGDSAGGADRGRRRRVRRAFHQARLQRRHSAPQVRGHDPQRGRQTLRSGDRRGLSRHRSRVRGGCQSLHGGCARRRGESETAADDVADAARTVGKRIDDDLTHGHAARWNNGRPIRPMPTTGSASGPRLAIPIQKTAVG